MPSCKARRIAFALTDGVTLIVSASIIVTRLRFWQFPQLGAVRRQPPRLVLGKQARHRSPSRLVLEIDFRECLPVVVITHDDAHRHL